MNKLALFVALLIPAWANAGGIQAYAVVDAKGNVVNTVLWDGSSKWSPPVGAQVVPDNVGAGIGWTWDGSQFQPPPQPQSPQGD